MNIKSDPMTNTMCEMTAISCLSNQLTGNSIKLTIGHACTSLCNQGLISRKNQLINLTLLVCHLSDMNSPCHITDIVLVITAKVKRQSLSLLNDFVCSTTMRHGRAIA